MLLVLPPRLQSRRRRCVFANESTTNLARDATFEANECIRLRRCATQRRANLMLVAAARSMSRSQSLRHNATAMPGLRAFPRCRNAPTNERAARSPAPWRYGRRLERPHRVDRYNRALPPGLCALQQRRRPNDMTKYVFVTGGVVSSLGKGIASASLAAILESRGLKVTLIKLDPYLNVDPGTMTPVPARRGVRHRRRRRDRPRPRPLRALHLHPDEAQQQLHHRSDLQERAREGAPRRLPRQDGAGDPARHQRDPGIHPPRRRRSARPTRSTWRSVEIGGTVGDIESLPLPRSRAPDEPEASGPNNTAFVHLTYVPWIAAAGELKTKPTQHTVQKLREIGIQPDALLCRADRTHSRRRAREDLAVHQRADAGRDLDVGRRHHLQGAAHAARAGPRRADLHEAAAAHPRRPTSSAGTTWCTRSSTRSDRGRASRCAASTPTCRTRYKSLNEALRHAGIHNHARVDIEYVDSETHDAGDRGPARRSSTPILVPGGFGKRGIEGKIVAAQYAREHRIPYLGICLGMQVATDRDRAPQGRPASAPTAPSSSPTRRTR